MKFFHNPKRKTTASRRKGKKRRTAAQRRATARMLAANKARRRGKKKATSMKRRRTLTRRSTMARKRRKSTTRRRRVTARRRPTTRRRRRSSSTIRFRRVRGAVYARNPGIVNMLTRGVMDAAVVVGGKAVSGFVGSKIPQFVPGTMGAVLNRVIAAIVTGFAASKVLSADRARLAVAGALAAPIESAIKGANIPLISEGLSDDEEGYYEVDMSGYPGIAGYPGMSGYPAIAAGNGGALAGDEEEYDYAYGQ